MVVTLLSFMLTIKSRFYKNKILRYFLNFLFFFWNLMFLILTFIVLKFYFSHLNNASDHVLDNVILKCFNIIVYHDYSYSERILLYRQIWNTLNKFHDLDLSMNSYISEYVDNFIFYDDIKHHLSIHYVNYKEIYFNWLSSLNKVKNLNMLNRKWWSSSVPSSLWSSFSSLSSFLSFDYWFFFKWGYYALCLGCLLFTTLWVSDALEFERGREIRKMNYLNSYNYCHEDENKYWTSDNSCNEN